MHQSSGHDSKFEIETLKLLPIDTGVVCRGFQVITTPC